MRVLLEVRSGPEAGRSIEVPADSSVTVGRKAPANFVIGGDPTLSRSHFSIQCDGTICRFRDLGSTGGTLLNGEPMTGAVLQEGDVIEAGSTTLIVRIDAQGAETAAMGRPRPLGPNETEGPPTEERPVLLGGPRPEVARLLRARSEPLYAILDAARDPLVLARIFQCGEPHRSLYEGIEADRLAEVAPYLIALPTGSPFLGTLVRDGWGKSWGVYLNCDRPFDEVRKHLRRFLVVKMEGGPDSYFRYYDPRVLGLFLQTCNLEEIAQFLGPIRCFLMEGASPDQFLSFEFDGRRLTRRPIQVGEPSESR